MHNTAPIKPFINGIQSIGPARAVNRVLTLILPRIRPLQTPFPRSLPQMEDVAGQLSLDQTGLMSPELSLDSWFQPPDPPCLGPAVRPGVLTAAELRQKFDRHAPFILLPQETRLLLEATLLLWHDQLEPAHRLVQDLQSADAAYLHGIVHRREPDFWNAKYWFRRAGRARVLPAITEAAKTKTRGMDPGDWASRLVLNGQWNPEAFVDLCETVAKSVPEEPLNRLAQSLQDIELKEYVRLLWDRKRS